MLGFGAAAAAAAPLAGRAEGEELLVAETKRLREENQKLRDFQSGRLPQEQRDRRHEATGVFPDQTIPQQLRHKHGSGNMDVRHPPGMACSGVITHDHSHYLDHAMDDHDHTHGSHTHSIDTHGVPGHTHGEELLTFRQRCKAADTAKRFGGSHIGVSG